MDRCIRNGLILFCSILQIYGLRMCGGHEKNAKRTEDEEKKCSDLSLLIWADRRESIKIDFANEYWLLISFANLISVYAIPLSASPRSTKSNVFVAATRASSTSTTQFNAEIWNLIIIRICICI